MPGFLPPWFPRKRRADRVVLPVALVLSCAALTGGGTGCGSGEINLYSRDSAHSPAGGDSNENTAPGTGGTVDSSSGGLSNIPDFPIGSGGILPAPSGGMGGAPDREELPDTGGADPVDGSGGITSTGGADGTGGFPSHDKGDKPCSETTSCSPTCVENASFCQQCDVPEDCNARFPVCDPFAGCVECSDDSQCAERFGSDFDKCAFNRCVQCIVDSDCPTAETCFGFWCGECRYHSDCADGEVCDHARCKNINF